MLQAGSSCCLRNRNEATCSANKRKMNEEMVLVTAGNFAAALVIRANHRTVRRPCPILPALASAALHAAARRCSRRVHISRFISHHKPKVPQQGPCYTGAPQESLDDYRFQDVDFDAFD
ncbi:unnamed protein product [Cladocopium goreaui]|uniref:Uncharacterized protein n=1 Tax=Cladocopium goreaui TaxID=2562237 RepID=A0A9P1DE54_9DINO|nr:unnamed protein product [Cladocopium goreaui]